MRISGNLISSTNFRMEMVMFGTDVTLTDDRHVSGFTGQGRHLHHPKRGRPSSAPSHCLQASQWGEGFPGKSLRGWSWSKSCLTVIVRLWSGETHRGGLPKMKNRSLKSGGKLMPTRPEDKVRYSQHSRAQWNFCSVNNLERSLAVRVLCSTC